MLAVILLCGVTACSSNSNDEPEVEEGTEETIIMFCPYSGLGSYILENISCLKKAITARGGLGNKRLFICYALNTTSASLYEITFPNGECYQKTISRDFDMTYNTSDQTKAISQLTDLITKVKAEAPARSYAMIIGCHGTSWFPAGNYLADYDNSGSTIFYSKAAARRKAFGSAAINYQIDNTSLVAALQATDTHLNYLLFDACYMASIEAAYDFRNICDYYIASPNEILDYGTPYENIGDALLNHDYKAVCDEFYNFYSTYTMDGKKYPYGSLTVVDTKYLDNMADIIRQINNTSGAISTTASLDNVTPMDGISPTIFYDLKNYYQQFCTNSSLLAQFNSTLSKLIYYERHTDKAYTYFNENKYIDIQDCCGLDFSQPTLNSAAQQQLQKTAFWQATH